MGEINWITRRLDTYMRLDSVALGIAVLLVAAVYPVPTDAVQFQPQPRVCTELFDRDSVVFVGTVLDERQQPSSDGEFWEAFIYRLDVQEVFTGILSSEVEVVTDNDSGRRILDLGQSYLLFAGKFKGTLYIGGGGNSSELSEATETIEEIRRVLAARKTAKTGSIRGHVYIVPFNIPKKYKQGAGGIAFIAESSAGGFSGVTDKNGWFSIEVPPGEYQVFPEPPRPDLMARAISYNDPEHVIIGKGTCAEVGFVVQGRND